MTKKPSWRARLFLMFGSLFVCLFFTEIALRLFWTPASVQSDRFQSRHPDYGFAPIAAAKGQRVTLEYTTTFEHTAQRLRGSRLVHAERDPSTRARVLFLGDSFTYGLGANNDQTFVALLAERWPEVELVNSGCSGYGQVEELAVLDRLGAAIKPDISVLMFFWNDLEDNHRTNDVYYEFAADGHVQRVRPTTPPEDALKLWPPEAVSKRSPWRRLYLSELWQDATKGLRYHWLGMDPLRIRDEEEKEAAWKNTERLFALLKHRADEIGTKLICVCIPDNNLVNPKAVIRNVKPLNIEVQQRLEQLCEQNSIPFFDPLSRFREAFAKRRADEPALYYYLDRHLTPAGYAIMADYLAEQLSPLLPTKIFSTAEVEDKRK